MGRFDEDAPRVIFGSQITCQIVFDIKDLAMTEYPGVV